MESIELKAINEIIDKKFIVPAYQRGYRWTEREVKDLLNDIWDFAQKRGEKWEDIGDFYCLQPIIIKEINGGYEVIDGQQRLTTVYIILKYLKKSNFNIEYEIRDKSKIFLENISDENLSEENIDFYFMSHAYKTIKDWFQEKEKEEATAKDEFYIYLGKHTKFIWYAVEKDADGIEIFTRVNVGRIPLTNAELVKALLLRERNFGKNDEIIKLRQLEIGSEWDNIEYSLQNDEFWYFLNKEENKIPTRIELIFNIIAEKPKGTDHYFTFVKFYDRFKEKEGLELKEEIDNLWDEVKGYFLTFQEWFDNKELYHKIGYLISTGEKVESLIKNARQMKKTDFRKFLDERIRESLGFDKLELLEYEQNNAQITRVLLLFNIFTILKSEGNNLRFSFRNYKKEKWSLEHIHAVNSKGLKSLEQKMAWLREHKQELEDIRNSSLDKNGDMNNIIEDIEKMLEDRHIDENSFNKMQEEIFKITGEPNINTIDNLALLSARENSSLSNSIFAIKRKKIIEFDKEGRFIPICTRNVFLKYYTGNTEQLFFWSEQDRASYLNAIREILKDYLPEEKEKNGK